MRELLSWCYCLTEGPGSVGTSEKHKKLALEGLEKARTYD